MEVNNLMLICGDSSSQQNGPGVILKAVSLFTGFNEGCNFCNKLVTCINLKAAGDSYF